MRNWDYTKKDIDKFVDKQIPIFWFAFFTFLPLVTLAVGDVLILLTEKWNGRYRFIKEDN